MAEGQTKNTLSPDISYSGSKVPAPKMCAWLEMRQMPCILLTYTLRNYF